MIYQLKNGENIESIPLGKSHMKIGEINKSGYLTIVDRGPNKNYTSGAFCICKCKCGKYISILYSSFKNNHTKSCGCLAKKEATERCAQLGKKSYYKDYTKVNNIFYDFINPINKYDKNGSQYWNIRCKKCNKIYKEIPVYIISESRRKGNNPCNCWRRISKGVLKIENVLDENNIKYIKEFSFNDCVSPKGNKLKFDFYLPDKNILIEYDGEQHSLPIDFGDTKISGEEKLLNAQLYDSIKNNYCIKNGLTLKRIPYTEYNNLLLDDLIGDKFNVN